MIFRARRKAIERSLGTAHSQYPCQADRHTCDRHDADGADATRHTIHDRKRYITPPPQLKRMELPGRGTLA